MKTTGTRSTWRKFHPSSTLSTTQPVGSNIRLRRDRPATNRMSHGTGHFEEQINPNNNKDSVPTSQTTRHTSLETQTVRALANGEQMAVYCEHYTEHKNRKNSASCVYHLPMKSSVHFSQRFSSNQAVNKLGIDYKNRSVNALHGNNRCLLRWER
jgi:hypothetical protein